MTKRISLGLGLALTLCLASCSPYDLNCPEDQISATCVKGTTPTTGPTTQPCSSGVLVPPTGPIKLDVATAILLALDNNKQLAVAKFNPPISRTAEMTALAAFDPTISGTVAVGRTENDQTNLIPFLPISITNTGNLLMGISEFLPTGTQFNLGETTNVNDPENGPASDNSRIGLGVTQSLLRGFGCDVNLATLRQTRIDTQISLYELRGIAMSIVAQTEEAYWDYVLAVRQIDIVTDSLELAQKQLDETNERIKIGRLAETERAASEAEVASRKQDLIVARAALNTAYLTLMQLISPPGDNPFTRPIVILQQPSTAEVPLQPIEFHVQIGEHMRPELNESRLQINRNTLEIVKTKNGLLPRLDLFATLGKTGYAKSIGGTLSDIFHGKSFDANVGLNGEFQLTNRTARAAYTRTLLLRDQDFKALENLSQTVEVDVREAYVNVELASEAVKATAATRRLEEVKLQAEQEKFRLNKSTSLQVAQVQRDLLNSQITEQQAIAAHLKALVELYRLEGSLLERRGITAPGGKPVAIVPQKN